MPGTISNGPSVALSFANNFWGKDDAGVEPLLQRMHNSKQTCDELRSFYASRSAIEDEYARKLLSLSRKSLGSQETGTLRASLDVLRGETEQMGKSHQNISSQMKTELEEPIAAFAGAMKERRKIVQTGIERLHKTKIQQTNQVNKTRDRYEQECLKIKGYLAQGHMVMGQEERKNKAKLEKTQVHLATSNTEYENAVKALEETTGRWNRDWKAAADKFQDLEEERLDFTKSSLWSFANIASTVCVSDDTSCEKIRLSLEKCEVEKDIASFIREFGTGQEIPDPPKYINFCRGDASDTQSENSDEEQYSVAQFQRTINPAYRSSSPQPSTYESHHEPPSVPIPDLDCDHSKFVVKESETLQKINSNKFKQPQIEDLSSPNGTIIDYPINSPRDQLQFDQDPQRRRQSQSDRQQQLEASIPSARQNPREIQQAELSNHSVKQSQFQQMTPRSTQRPQQDYINQAMMSNYQSQQPQEPIGTVPHDPYPMDGMTMFCRTGPSPSERSPHNRSNTSPSVHDLASDRISHSSQEAMSAKVSPDKQCSPSTDTQSTRKKSGFFQSRSPFRRRSNKLVNSSNSSTQSNRNTWSATTLTKSQASPINKSLNLTPSPNGSERNRESGSPDTIDPMASLQLNVGNNVFDVETSERNSKTNAPAVELRKEEEIDPIAQALAELKGVTKASLNRVSADKYHGIPTPAPSMGSPSRITGSQMTNSTILAGQRGTPPPRYDSTSQRLGLPQPAFTSKAMQHTKQKYATQTQNMFSAQVSPDSRIVHGSGSQPRPVTRGNEIPRALSPAPPRDLSPRVEVPMGNLNTYRSASPNPFYESQQNNQQIRQKVRSSEQAYYLQNSPSDIRAASPSMSHELERPSSRHHGSDISMQMQLASVADDNYGSPRGRILRPSGAMSPRPMSMYGSGGGHELATRQRSKSVIDSRQYNCQGRPILHFARALYSYQAAIPEELSFFKGDILAVLRHQDDGWWEAEIAGKNERPGLVPSNYVQNL